MNGRRFAAGLALVLGAALPWPGAGADGPGGPEDSAIAHRLFDANHCLEGIERHGPAATVVFRWGCGGAKMITMSCVHDRAGYRGLGPRFARPGWHCNYPLPVLEEAGRESDVAVGDVTGRAVWAACFVEGYGDFASRPKPYHGTACWRALRAIGRAVNRDGLDPAAVARRILR